MRHFGETTVWAQRASKATNFGQVEAAAVVQTGLLIDDRKFAVGTAVGEVVVVVVVVALRTVS